MRIAMIAAALVLGIAPAVMAQEDSPANQRLLSIWLMTSHPLYLESHADLCRRTKELRVRYAQRKDGANLLRITKNFEWLDQPEVSDDFGKPIGKIVGGACAASIAAAAKVRK